MKGSKWSLVDLLILFYIQVRCLSSELRTSITLQASTRMLSHYYALYESVICHACCDLAQFLILCTLFGTRVKLSLNSWTIRILSQAFQNFVTSVSEPNGRKNLEDAVSFLFYSLLFISIQAGSSNFLHVLCVV